MRARVEGRREREGAAAGSPSSAGAAVGSSGLRIVRLLRRIGGIVTEALGMVGLELRGLVDGTEPSREARRLVVPVLRVGRRQEQHQHEYRQLHPSRVAAHGARVHAAAVAAARGLVPSATGLRVLAVPAMPLPRPGERGNAALVVVLVLLGLGLAVPLVLHFTQKAHDQLPVAVLEEYPPERPFVPGEIYASTLAALMDHELRSGTGWRPNDFVLWGPGVLADNNANRQRGIILAVRESTRVLKDHLTKVSSTEYDPNLVTADSAFRNDETRFMLPSAESRFRDGVAALRRYVEGLRTTPPQSKPIAGRNVELIRLMQTWGDLLGDAHANLFKTREADGSRDRPVAERRLLLSRAGRRPRHPPSGARAAGRVPPGPRRPSDRPDAPQGGDRLARRRGHHEAAHRPRRQSVGAHRQSPAQPRRLHCRRAAEAVLDPGGAREVADAG